LNAVVIVYAETGSVIVAATYAALAEVARQDRLTAFIAEVHGDRRIRAHLRRVSS
jgi:hypothetical protein